MGFWKEDIYGNDIAQDTIVYLKKAYEKYNCIDSAIKDVKNKDLYNYAESKLVLADFELDIKGSVSNFSSVSKVLKQELSEGALYEWNEPSLRRVHLENFRDKLSSNKLSDARVNKDKHISDVVKDWIYIKSGLSMSYK